MAGARKDWRHDSAFAEQPAQSVKRDALENLPRPVSPEKQQEKAEIIRHMVNKKS